jgi:transposase
VPPTPIPKSIATASLLSQIITSKYQYVLPLYRQEQMFKQYGIELSRKTMADWMIRCSELLVPIYQRLKTIQLQQSVMNTDETPMKVIHEDKNRSMTAGEYDPPPIAVDVGNFGRNNDQPGTGKRDAFSAR